MVPSELLKGEQNIKMSRKWLGSDERAIFNLSESLEALPMQIGHLARSAIALRRTVTILQ